MFDKKDKAINNIELLQLSNNLTSIYGIDSILKTISNETISLLNADRCSIFIYDPIKQLLWSKVAHGLEIDIIRLKLGEGIAGLVAKNKSIMNIRDAYDNEHFSSHIDESTGYKTKTLLACPLLNISHDLVGVIEVLNKKDGKFNKRDENFLEIISKLSAIAVEQAQLYEWNRLLRQYNENIIKNISSGLIVLDGNFRVTMMNRVAETILNPFTKGLNGKIIIDEVLFFSELESFLEDLKNNGSAKIDNVEISYNNETRFFNIRASELKSKTEEDYGYNILIDDISEKVLLERENKQKENLSLIGNMTSSIIHDIKNPISIITAYLQIMNKRSDDDRFKHYFSIIDREINRLIKMTEEVLHFARGEYKINLETCRIGDFIEEITPLIKQLFQKKQINLKIDIQNEDIVTFDRDKIRRLIYNIASNADVAMDKGGLFEIRMYKTLNSFRMHFKDNGYGISKHIYDKVMIPFSTYGKADGIGLGMAIVKKIVDEHKGDIKINSEEGVGTEIIITLSLDPYKTEK